MKEAVATLIAHAGEQRLVERAQAGFQAWAKEGTGNLPRGWTHDELRAQLDSINLCFQPGLVGYPYIDTKLDILREDVSVGHYRLITKLDGSAVDDYFVLQDLGE